MNGANVDGTQLASSSFSGMGAHVVAQYDPASGSTRALGKIDVITVVRRLDDGVVFVANHVITYFRNAGSVSIGAVAEVASPFLSSILSGISVAFDATGTSVRATVTLGVLATGTFEAAVYYDGKGFFL